MSSRRMPSGQGPARTSARPGSAAPRFSRRDTPHVGARTHTTPRTSTVDTRSERRPAAIRRPASDASAKRIRAVRQKKLSGRATVLALLLLVMALAYAYPLRVYLAQQNEISSLEASQAAQRARIQALQDALKKWKDPAYVIAQAKERLHYVFPGEIAYVVVNGEDPATSTGDSGGSTPTWFSQLMASITAADGGN